MTTLAIVRFDSPDHLTNGLYVQLVDDGDVTITDLDGETVSLGNADWTLIKALGEADLDEQDAFFDMVHGDQFSFDWHHDQDLDLPAEGSLWEAWDKCLRHDVKCTLLAENGEKRGSVSAKGYTLT